MGNFINYRPTPRRIHSVEGGKSPYYVYGASQITGWRLAQEDRYLCIPDFHENFGLFAVYDGHGGGHAVQYLQRYLHENILGELIKHEDPELALYLGFITTDLCLRNIMKNELKLIDNDLDIEFEVPDKEERRYVLRQYQSRSGDSPGTSKNDSDVASTEPGTSQGISQPDLATQDLKAQIASAFISELKSVKFLTQDEMEDDESDEEYDPDKDNIKLNYFGRTLDEDDDGDDEEEEESSSESEESIDNEDLAKEPSGNQHEETADEQNLAKEPSENKHKETKDEQNLAKNENEDSGKEEDCEGESEKIDSDVEICEIVLPDCSTEESSSKYFNFVKPDSKFCETTGSTATVLLLNDRKLYIANVGDSRCVACVDGQAIDLTVDHKPTKREEKRRIFNAGGFVQDGRVSGILDLSRAFGDFLFKKKNVAEPFQMLTCEPFITSLDISDKLEFLIIASDGIWNSMNSNDVVNHVKNRMQDTAHVELQDICGEMFESLLPTTPTEDGTGCDNLTAVLICFQKQAGNTSISGLQDSYTFNYSFFTRENRKRKGTSIQESTSSSVHTKKSKNEGPTWKEHCLPDTDYDDIPLEPIPGRSPSLHGDGENENFRHPSDHSSMHCNKQAYPHYSYDTDDNSQAHLVITRERIKAVEAPQSPEEIQLVSLSSDEDTLDK